MSSLHIPEALLPPNCGAVCSTVLTIAREDSFFEYDLIVDDFSPFAHYCHRLAAVRDDA